MTFRPQFIASLVALTGLAFSFPACSQTSKTTGVAPAETAALPPVLYVTIIRNTEGKHIGTAEISDQGAQGVKLSVKASGIPEGAHGMHFHVMANCTTPDFKSAGGHINPMGMAHGLENPDGPDNADMPNAIADSSNMLDLKVVNDRVSLNGGHDLPALRDEDGSALVIHALPDDQMTQPIGGAGPRIACAEIKK